MSIFSKRKLGAAVALATLATGSFNAPVYAEEETIENIVVTGSRIQRASGAYTPTPMSVTTSEQIEFSGTVNLGDFLNELPQLRSTYSLQNSSRFIGTTGLNLLDLRGMGTSRTLVLQDGNRHIGGSNGTSSVDINTIPQDLVDRVEIITGGASAIYGADAVTGVVNFVMKDDYEGLKIRTQFSQPSDDGGEESNVAFTWGTNFADGRGNFAFAAEWTDTTGIDGVDRDWITDSPGGFYNPEDTGPNDGIPDQFFLNNRTDTRISPAGVIYGPHPLTNHFGLPDFLIVPLGYGLVSGPYTFDENGNLRAFDTGELYVDPISGLIDNSAVGGDGLRFAQAEQLLPDIERLNLFARVRYDFNEHLTVKAEVKHTQVDSESYGQPSFDFLSSDLYITRDNAFLPADLAAIMDAEGATGFFLNRFNYDLGNREEIQERETTRIVVSAEGLIADDWYYDVTYVWSEYDGDAFAGNNRHNGRYRQAVDAVFDASGNIVCRDPAAQAAGCVPMNMFGENQFDRAGLAYITEPDSGFKEEMSQTVFTAAANGPLFELPAGQIMMATGFEYREEESAVTFSDAIKFEDTFFNALADTDADYDVKEYFVEFSIPLIADMPGFDSLTLDTAGRWSDYNTIGETATWKWGLDWSITEDVRLRVTDSRAVRAPNIAELFDPLQQNFFSVTDPCSETALDEAPDPAQRLANCNALGRPAGYESQNDTSSIGGLSGGNVGLREETSDSFTYGIVFTPTFIENLVITVDYWEAEIADAIAVTPAQEILDRCVDGVSIDNIYCPLITRDADFDINQDNGILRQTQNISALEVEGVDYEIDYTWDLASTFDNVPGTLQFNLNGSHLMKLDEFVFQEDPGTAIDTRGVLGDPENSFVLNTTYRTGNWTANWRARWLDGMRLLANEDRDDLQDPLNTDSVMYHDVQVRYFMPDTFGGALEIFGGVRNLADEEPQEYLTGNGGGSGIYDTYGRTFYLGLVYDMSAR